MSRKWSCHSVPVPAFPLIVNVEVFRGRCPCRCLHCPVGRIVPHERPIRFGVAGMAPELLCKVAREIAAHPPAVLRVHSTGDPVNWDGLFGALTTMRETTVPAWLFTSAVTQDRDLLAAICQTCQVIEVSVNSHTREDYRATKGVDAFDLVAANLRFMSAQLSRIPRTRLIVSRVQSDEPAVDAAFVAYWKSTGLVEDAFVRTRHTYNRLVAPEPDAPRCSKRGPCLVHWARFNISVTGQAVVCFNELFRPRLGAHLVYGDLNAETITTLWHSPKLNALRQAELSGDYLGLPFGDSLPCRDCDCFQPLFGTPGVDTSEHQLRQLDAAGDRRAEALS